MGDLPELCSETIWAILNNEIDDLSVNQMVWYYLGYRCRGDIEFKKRMQ